MKLLAGNRATLWQPSPKPPEIKVSPVMAAALRLGFTRFAGELFSTYAGNIYLGGGAVRAFILRKFHRVPANTLDYDWNLFQTKDQVLEHYPQAKLEADADYAPVKLKDENGVNHDLTLEYYQPGCSKLEVLRKRAYTKRDLTINCIMLEIKPDGTNEIHDPFNGVTDLINKQFRFPNPTAFTTKYVQHPDQLLRLVRFDLELFLLFGERFNFSTKIRAALKFVAEEGAQEFFAACLEKQAKVRKHFSKFTSQFGEGQAYTFIVDHYPYLLPMLIHTNLLTIPKLYQVLMSCLDEAKLANTFLSYVFYIEHYRQEGYQVENLKKEVAEMILVLGRVETFRIISRAGLMDEFFRNQIINPYKEFYENVQTLGVGVSQTFANRYFAVNREAQWNAPVEQANSLVRNGKS